MRPNKCKHCQSPYHYSFQCNLIRKPIKSKSFIEQAGEHYEKIEVAQNKIRSHIAKANPKKEKGVAELLKLAELVFNKWIRNRDKGSDGTFKCMCCGVFFSNKDMDAGHMYAKNYSSTRFHEDNVWGQAAPCNRLNYGNVKQFKLRVLAHIGEERFEALRELKNQPKKWEREELLDIIKKYKI